VLPVSASGAAPVHRADATATADERRERWLAAAIRLVVGGGILLFGVAIGQIASTTMTAQDIGDLAIITVVVAIAGRLMVHVRLGSARHTQSLTDVAMVCGFMVVGVPCLTVAVAVGIAAAKASARVAPQRIAFNAAKDVIVVGVAGYAATLLGDTPPIVPLLRTLPALLLLAVLIVAVDEALVIPVVAMASGRRVRAVFAHAWRVRLGTAALRLALTIGAGYLFRSDPRMVFTIPLIVLGLHLWHANRMQQHTDKLAWQRLARIVDALAAADEQTVRAEAVHGAAELFACDEIELYFHDLGGTAQLWRGDARTITYAGSAALAPPRTGMVVTAALDIPGGDAELRLRFQRVVTFTEREHYTLRALAAALGTALRKANAVSTAAQMASDQAHAAIHDQLTGLVNRRRLLEYGAEQRIGLIGLAVLDLKGFKRINDGLGQTVGDEVLLHVANAVSSTVRDTGLAARLGADQFAVLYPQIGASSAAIAKVRHLLNVIATPFSVDGIRMEVNATAGIAVGPSAGGVEELLRRADVAMHHAKREEQPMSIYVRGRDTADVGRLALGADLARAVSKREFTFAFQPIVDLGTGVALSAEALARWPHPRHGQLTPHRFLDAIERSGLLAAFTEQVLDRSLAGAARWREAGFDLPVAVNVSPRSLLDPGLPVSILAALSAYALPPSSLIIELTETLTISQLEVVDDVLHQLRDLGIMLALDDFGTGYSSLATIARVPVGELKIDRTFVAGMAGATESAIVRSTIELGRSLDLLVVAEGIESDAQRAQLWALGCPAGQGHLFGRPMPVEQFIAKLSEGEGGVPGRLIGALHPGGDVRRLRRPGS
jgi:diguanylate cyclase (GGDEF)-like protein